MDRCANRLRLWFLALALAPTGAGALTFVSECDDFYMKQQTNALEFRCRSTAQPWLVVTGCVRASAKKDSNGVIKITCGPGSFQTDPKVSVKVP